MLWNAGLREAGECWEMEIDVMQMFSSIQMLREQGEGKKEGNKSSFP